MSEQRKKNWLHRLADWISSNIVPSIMLASLVVAVLLLLVTVAALVVQLRGLNVQVNTLKEQLKAPELVYSKSWHPAAAQPAEVQIREAADALYKRFFTEASILLVANPLEDYEVLLDAILRMTTTIPSVQGGTLRIVVRNDGEETEETIRVGVQASEGWTISSEKYEGNERATIIEGGEGSNSIKYEVDRLVPDDQFGITLSLDSTEEFARQLTLQRRRGIEDFEEFLRYEGYTVPLEWQPEIFPWMFGMVDQGIEIVALSPSFPHDVSPQVEVTGASGKARESSSL